MASEVTAQPIASTSNINGTDVSSEQPLSKNAQKKLAKRQRIAEYKKERRAQEKEKKKEKKRLRAEKIAAGEIDEEEEERNRKRARMERKEPFRGKVVIDLGFDELMSENEINSLTSQLAFTYSANRRAVQPFDTLLFTSLNGRTFTRMEGISEAAYRRWNHCEWWTGSYEKLWSEAGPSDGISEESTTPSVFGDFKTRSTAPRESVVYLTADTEEELAELREDETYIIGGLCDHNRYKNLCYEKSQKTNVRSARLPIGTYLSELKTRKVLTVNQTFEILLKWLETRDWREALFSVMPKRKFQNAVEGSATGGDEAKEGDDEETERIVVPSEAVEDVEEPSERQDNVGVEPSPKQ